MPPKRLPADSPVPSDMPKWITRLGEPLEAPPRTGASGRSQLPLVRGFRSSWPWLGAGSSLLRPTLPPVALAGAPRRLRRGFGRGLRRVGLSAAGIAAWTVAPRRLLAAWVLLIGVGAGFAFERSLPAATASDPLHTLTSSLPGPARGPDWKRAVDFADSVDPLREVLSEFGRTTAALELYRARHGRYPSSEEGYSGALFAAAGPWARRGGPAGRDPWGRELRYAASPSGYLLRSVGPDGAVSDDDVYVTVEDGRANYHGLP